MKEAESIGILGYGTMGQVIASRLSGDYRVCVFDIDASKTQTVSAGVESGDLESVLASGVLIVAVKPQDAPALLRTVRSSSRAKASLVVSIAAGLSTAAIEQALGTVRVVRVMPNLACRVGQGMSGISQGRFAASSDVALVERLFRHLGKTLIVPEEMMDALTAVSGSGPGFFFERVDRQPEAYANGRERFAAAFAEELARAAEHLGFSHEQATLLASATTEGSAALLKQCAVSAGALCRQVASPGGTTQAGLEALRSGQTLEQAVQAAAQRARQLNR